MSSDSLVEKSAKRLEHAKSPVTRRWARPWAKAGAEFAPVVQNLSDQILFLGRDLSPAAVADLQDEAAELNQQAADVTEKVSADASSRRR